MIFMISGFLNLTLNCVMKFYGRYVLRKKIVEKYYFLKIKSANFVLSTHIHTYIVVMYECFSFKQNFQLLFEMMYRLWLKCIYKCLDHDFKG